MLPLDKTWLWSAPSLDPRRSRRGRSAKWDFTTCLPHRKWLQAPEKKVRQCILPRRDSGLFFNPRASPSTASIVYQIAPLQHPAPGANPSGRRESGPHQLRVRSSLERPRPLHAPGCCTHRRTSRCSATLQMTRVGGVWLERSNHGYLLCRGIVHVP